MKKLNKIVSTLLTVCMLAGALSGLFVFEVSAANEEEIDLSAIDYTTQIYYTPEEKLATMSMMFEKGDYQLWVNSYTGEVCTVNTKTGEKLFSNPYNVGSSKAVASLKGEFLSQILLSYTSIISGTANNMNSFADAAKNNQIKVKNIKNGVRVEYTLGREETKYLCPRLITADRFEEFFGADSMGEAMAAEGKSWYYEKKFLTFFTLRDPVQFEGDDRKLSELYSELPITQKVGAVYQINSGITAAELISLEGYIKTYVPTYTYEELDADHEKTQYVSEDVNPPVFKMALEYKLDNMGMTVTLPANGIRFDESLYQLTSLTLLPYMGAGFYSESVPNTGYTFLPDGSGAIFRFEDLSASGGTVSGQVYGQDYAYHNISGKYQEVFRMPVYGIVQDNIYSYAQNSSGLNVLSKNDDYTSSGFLAVVEEGEALSTIKSYHLGSSAEYHTVQLTVNPRPSDTYNLADSISVGNTSSWTVVSDRKYVGNYTVRYFMLTDDKVAQEKGIVDYYPASYFGMAKAYQSYLTSAFSTGTQNLAKEEQTSVLKRLNSAETESDTPLYIETFGTIETVEKILSIPVNVMTPLTTFDDIVAMYNELSKQGNINNINFKLTGYANGGMKSTMPYKLKWEKAVGGKGGFKDLLEFAASVNNESPTDGKNIGIFPDFDFAYVNHLSSFDGVSLDKHAVKTIDGRYTTKRTYTSTHQSYESDRNLAISPAYFSRFYEKLNKNYLKFINEDKGINNLNISVSTLGTDLNSDFDEDEPYNREDSKAFTLEALKNLSENYADVMTTGGNAYTWQYVDHILGMSIDSSRYLMSSNAIPFTGIVLHGYMQYTGTAINMEGNLQYGVLKAIESGASLYFILTYQNATKLKENATLNSNYSVRYDIWAGSYNEEGEFIIGELIDLYHELNDVTKDLQTKLIIGHEMLKGSRIPDPDELIADEKQEALEKVEAEKKAAEDAAAKALKEHLEARVSVVDNTNTLLSQAKSRLDIFKGTFNTTLLTIQNFVKNIENAKATIASAPEGADVSAQEEMIDTAILRINSLYTTSVASAYDLIEEYYNQAIDKVRLVEEAVEFFRSNGTYAEEFIASVEANVAPVQENVNKIKEVFEEVSVSYNQVVEAAGEYLKTEDDTDDDTDTNSVKEKYRVEDGTIVAVTYGETGAAYRTFILNYNYFAIQVEYAGVTYTIEPYGYSVINYND